MARGTRLLLTQRNTALYLERASVRVEGSRVVYDKAEGKEEKVFNIPYANVAILFLGQGTSLTQSAARLLAEEGVYIAFTGSGGSPLHYGSLTNYQVTEHMHQMYRVATSPEASLDAAKRAMLKRVETTMEISPVIWERTGISVEREDFEDLREALIDALPQIGDTATLMRVEANMTKSLYRIYAEATGAKAFTRQHGKRDHSDRVGLINARLDHGNYIAYGVAGSALWMLGVPASLSFFHGKTRAGGLVFDLADTFKDAIVLPLAFADFPSEAAFRASLIDTIQDHKVLKRCFDFMAEILATEIH